MFKPNYSYTWSLHRDAKSAQLDEFLFTEKAGFCRHYAPPLAYMLRDLQTCHNHRMSLGYQRWRSSSGNVVSVHQFDAITHGVRSLG